MTEQKEVLKYFKSIGFNFKQSEAGTRDTETIVLDCFPFLYEKGVKGFNFFFGDIKEFEDNFKQLSERLYTSDEIHKLVNDNPKLIFTIREKLGNSHVIRIQKNCTSNQYSFMIRYPDNSGGESFGLWENTPETQRQKKRFRILFFRKDTLK